MTGPRRLCAGCTVVGRGDNGTPPNFNIILLTSNDDTVIRRFPVSLAVESRGQSLGEKRNEQNVSARRPTPVVAMSPIDNSSG